MDDRLEEIAVFTKLMTILYSPILVHQLEITQKLDMMMVHCAKRAHREGLN